MAAVHMGLGGVCGSGWGGGGGVDRQREAAVCITECQLVSRDPGIRHERGGGAGSREQKAGGAGAYQIALSTCAQQMMAAVHMGCELQCMLSVHNQLQAHHGRQDV
jgi:hypothetical protein